MSNALANLAVMTVASSGPGTITLSSAATINGVSYLDFASAGVKDQQLVYYSIQDTGQSEAGGPATYTSSSLSLARAPVTTTNGNAAIDMSRQAIVLITPISNQMREVLTTSRNYYVLTTGLDSNTGLVNSSAGAFLTLQQAIDTARALDLSINSVVINVGSGTFTSSLGNSIGSYIGAGPITIVGQGSSLTTVDGQGSASFFVSNAGAWNINSLKMISSGYYNLFASGSLTAIGMTGVEFSTNAVGHMRITNDATLRLFAYSMSGTGGPTHWQADSGGKITCVSVAVTNNSSAMNFSNAFAVSDGLSNIWCEADTFPGSSVVTGTRYNVSKNSIINTAGASSTYLPGNSSGVSATGGLYV